MPKLYEKYMGLFSKKNSPKSIFTKTISNVLTENAEKIMPEEEFKKRYEYWKEYLKDKTNDEQKAEIVCNKMGTNETCDTDCLKSIADCPKQQRKLAKIANLYNFYNNETKVDVNTFSKLDIFNLKDDEEELFIKVITWFDTFVNKSMGGKRKSYRRKNPKKKTRKYRRKSVRRH